VFRRVGLKEESKTVFGSVFRRLGRNNGTNGT